MTRELKLALIVGFLVVLVVFVLIADHWSTANRSELAVNTPARPVLVPSVPVDSAPMAALETEVPAPQGSILTAAVERELDAAARVGAGQDQAVLIADAGNMEPVSPFPPPVEIEQGARSELASAGDTGHEALLAKLREVGADIRNGEIQMPRALRTDREPLGGGADRDGEISARPEPVRTESGRDGPIPTEPKAAKRWHTVSAGDSLYKIAKQHYGDGKHWRKLAEFNKDRVGEDGSVRLGSRIELPPVEVITGRPALQPAERPAAKQAEPKPEPKVEPRRLSSPSTYTVRRGDTLGEIAQRLLGSSRRASEIVELNKSLIKDPNNVPAGVELKLPEV